MWPAAFTIALTLLTATAMLCLWLLVDRRSLKTERDLRRREQEDQAGLIENLKNQLRTLDKDIAVAHETHRAFEKHFDQAQKQLRETFDALAGDALKKSNEQFLQLARKSFEGEQKEAAAQLEQRKLAVKALVDPIREKLDQYNRSIQDIERSRKEAYGSLGKQLEMLMTDQGRLRTETANLVNALRRPEVRGRWGELQLERVLELAGMTEHCSYEKQCAIIDEGSRLIPDVLVKLPNGRQIVIDIKTPIDAFITATQATNEDDRRKHLTRHASQLADRAKELSGKAYWSKIKGSPEFVVMFIPGESFLLPAVEIRPDLLEWAMNRKVVITTPTMLVPLLKTVALGWREHRIAENARRISDLGQELHERIATATGHVERLGSNLEKAVTSYNDFVGSFETRVVTAARKFKELGADSPKELPAEGAIKKIERMTRSLKAAESIQDRPVE